MASVIATKGYCVNACKENRMHSIDAAFYQLCFYLCHDHCFSSKDQKQFLQMSSGNGESNLQATPVSRMPHSAGKKRRH